MKKISALLGLGILGVVLISFTGTHKCPSIDNGESIGEVTATSGLFDEGLQWDREAEKLKIVDLNLVEIEEDIDLGFDTALYLPIGFNAYEGMALDLDDIVLIEDEEVIDLGFDSAQYLPEGFNAYEGM